MTKQYKVGIYCRLSVDDASNSAKAKHYIPSEESVSIENQYEILSKFAMLNGWIEVKTYRDDGYSGGNFQRPGFLEMLEDARHGLINLILVKDLSRLGRDFVEVGRYTDVVFPSLGCRFVSVLDCLDSEGDNTDMLHFRSLMNDYHLKDLSSKIRSVLHAKKKSGQYVAAYAPYGYRNRNCFLRKREIFFRGGEAVVEPWEDELLWDDDFSDEEEDTEEQIEEADLEMDEDSFADWEDSSDTAPEDERLEETLAEERTLELESELEQDEHPRDYHAELEDEEEEAAPNSEKRLKREIRAEALKRLEEAARTESDFLTVVDEWNKLDRNRERRERDHEKLRGDVPLEFQAVPDPKIAPLWMNLPRFRQLCQGNFLDIIFSCPYELHELTANRFLSKLFFTLSDEQKEVLYYLFVKQYRTTRLAAIRGQSDRNIRKLRMTIQKKLQRRMYEHLSEKLENDHGLTLREREFVEEYEALLQTMGKDAVIRRENKTKLRKKKTALDDVKDG